MNKITQNITEDIKAWPFQEANRLIDQLSEDDCNNTIIFQTGYGPSGLPHIGTFGEVARTLMVQNAFKVITRDEIKTKLICFSDDMDALRKVPENIPNQDKMLPYIGMPLTKVPDPFGEYNSFGEHNNARLKMFLDKFNFSYEFVSSTDYYTSGIFDETLKLILLNHDKICSTVTPILGSERKASYSPILPICPITGEVLQVKINECDVKNNTISFTDPNTKKETEVSILKGKCKLQWRADWAMRWKALKVNYEMSGKDLIDSVKISSKICRIIKGIPPEGFNYELFLDENGEKISKSRGNGISIESWLKYATQESLSLFMFQSPRKAKRLYFDIIPKNVDEYNTHLMNYYKLKEEKEKFENPVWHIHSGNPPKIENIVSFSLLLNLVSASNSEDKNTLWGFIKNYIGENANPDNNPLLDQMIEYAISYFHDFVKPNKVYRLATKKEKGALISLSKLIGEIDKNADNEEIQTLIYQVGKDFSFEPLKDWFSAIYEVLLGLKQGPRFGSFVAIYGIKETQKLIKKALDGKLITKEIDEKS
jgi:lysyl-tRNA synthetase, class I